MAKSPGEPDRGSGTVNGSSAHVRYGASSCALGRHKFWHLLDVQLFSHLVDEPHIDHFIIGNRLLENASIAHDSFAGHPGFLRDEAVPAVDAIGKAPIEGGLEVILTGGRKLRLGEVEHLNSVSVCIDKGTDNCLDKAPHRRRILFNHIAAHAQGSIGKGTEFFASIEDWLGPDARLVKLGDERFRGDTEVGLL